MSQRPIIPTAAILAGKKPIAPAPVRYTSPPALGASLAKPPSALARPIQLDADLSSDSSEEEALQLVARTPTTGYAELDVEVSEEEEDGTARMLEDDELGGADRDELIRARVAASQEQMRTILASLSEEQLQRYETFRRVGFPRPMIKKVIGRVLESLAGGKDKTAANSVNPSTVIVVAGIAKVFVGELVEEARMVLEEWGDDAEASLMPAHILEAQRRLKRKNVLHASTNHQRRSPLL